MLRWYLAGLIFLAIVSPAVGFSVYRYVMHHPAVPGTMIGRVYEKTVKKKLMANCTQMMADYAKSTTANSETQYSAVCECFTDDLFETFRKVPPGELDDVVELDETKRSAAAIFDKCANQSGLN